MIYKSHEESVFTKFCFLPDDPRCPVLSFLISSRIPIANMKALLETNSFNFYLSENIFISPSFLKDSFVRYIKFVVDGSFLPTPKNTVPLLFYSLWFQRNLLPNPMSIWCHFC